MNAWQHRDGPLVHLTNSQREALEDIWFIYGNNGPKSTRPQHKFIQAILEVGKDFRRYYDVSPECIDEVDRILNANR